MMWMTLESCNIKSSKQSIIYKKTSYSFYFKSHMLIKSIRCVQKEHFCERSFFILFDKDSKHLRAFQLFLRLRIPSLCANFVWKLGVIFFWLCLTYLYPWITAINRFIMQIICIFSFLLFLVGYFINVLNIQGQNKDTKLLNMHKTTYKPFLLSISKFLSVFALSLAIDLINTLHLQFSKSHQFLCSSVFVRTYGYR